MQRNDVCDGQFRGNVLIAGKTGCGKTHFMQKLAVNNFFRKIVKTEWVLSIQLTPTREAEMQASFSCDVTFHYPQTLYHLDEVIEDFKLKTIGNIDSINDSEYSENKKIERLIVMDDVSGLADRSNTFADFLAVIRNSAITACIYFTLFYQKNKSGKK